MRFLLTILCFITLQAQGQALFHAHNKASAAPADYCGGVTDANACAYLTATKITDATLKSAVNQLVIDLKDSSLWTLAAGLWPMRSDGVELPRSEQTRYNLKDTALYKITWMGGTFDANGVDGFSSTSNNYGQTGLIPSSALTLNSTHISYYSGEEGGSGDYSEMGTMHGGERRLQMHIRLGGVFYGDEGNQGAGTGRVWAMNSTAMGLHLMSRTANNSLKIYRNGVKLAEQTATDGTAALSTYELFIGAVNNAGTPQLHTDRQVRFASAGAGMTEAQARAFNTIIERFLDACGSGVQ